jgi:two-component system chemotaxis response regulator CheY
MPKAMVVDDSRAIRMILSQFLMDLNFDVSQAADGKQALAMLPQDRDVSLVLVDWNMPEMNGLEFVKQVRGNARYDDIRLMMVTTETEVEQVLKALEAGANEFVMKPFTKDVIADKLRLIGAIE